MLRTSSLAVAIALLAPPLLRAQQDSVPEVVTIVNFGLVDARGNARLTSLSASEKLAYKPRDSRWTLSQEVQWVYGRNDDSTTASLLLIGAQAGYELTKRLSLRAGVTFDRDRFAGIVRRFQEQLGLGYQIWDGARDHLDAEVGAAFTQRRTVDEVSDNFVAARVAGTYVHQLAERSRLQQTLEVLPNVDDFNDVRLNSETSLVAPLSNRLSLKVAYVIRFSNRPPDGFEKTDRVLTTELQLSL